MDGKGGLRDPKRSIVEMKIKRYKAAKKNLSFYMNNFGFRLPHQVLIDGTFTNYALKNQTNIKDQLPKYLGGEVQLLTTSCALHEVQSMGKELYGAYIILKRYKLRHCSHQKNPVSAANCFKSLVGEENSHHYFIATQDLDLNQSISQVPGAPLLYIHTNAIVLDKPSRASLNKANFLTTNRTSLSSFEQETLQKLKGVKDGGVIELKKKKRKKKGPNPLSCKKKKVKGTQVPTGDRTSGKKRKRRKRLKIAEHVIQEMTQDKIQR